MNRLLLTDSVHSRHSLRVNLRVPVRIVQNARVRGLQVDPEAARPGGQEEREHRGIRSVKRGDVDGPLDSVGAPVEPRKLVPAEGEKVAQYVQHRRELREQHHPMPLVLQPAQDTVQHREFTRSLHQFLHRDSILRNVRPGEEVRVVAALA